MTTPKQDGFFMPAEFDAHLGCILIWPHRAGSWRCGAKPAEKAFANVIKAIAESEHVFVCCQKDKKNDVRRALRGVANVTLCDAETDDSWARDIAPTFVKNRFTGEIRAVSWEFNAWGGTVDGLYAHWDKDNAFAKQFADQFHVPVYNASPFVLEGGSIHSDGEGTLLVTESCLLSKGRNPDLTKAQIEETLIEYLGAEKILWLPRGIFHDETNEHVDNVCAFVRPAEVALAWTDEENDPQYPLSHADLTYLESATDAKGRKIKVHKLPIPDVPITVSEKDLAGFVFEEGETVREAGERLAASYCNFYFSNGAVVLPVFGGENEQSDRRAIALLERLCPERKVVPVPAREILLGGGNIHCITQQIPAGKITDRILNAFHKETETCK